jgi:hypothetical protein
MQHKPSLVSNIHQLGDSICLANRISKHLSLVRVTLFVLPLQLRIMELTTLGSTLLPPIQSNIGEFVDELLAYTRLVLSWSSALWYLTR